MRVDGELNEMFPIWSGSDIRMCDVTMAAFYIFID